MHRKRFSDIEHVVLRQNLDRAYHHLMVSRRGGCCEGLLKEWRRSVNVWKWLKEMQTTYRKTLLLKAETVLIAKAKVRARPTIPRIFTQIEVTMRGWILSFLSSSKKCILFKAFSFAKILNFFLRPRNRPSFFRLKKVVWVMLTSLPLLAYQPSRFWTNNIV